MKKTFDKSDFLKVGSINCHRNQIMGYVLSSFRLSSPQNVTKLINRTYLDIICLSVR